MRNLAKKDSNAMTGGQTKHKKVNRRPTTGEILDPQYLQKLEAANGGGPGSTATDKTASKKSKPQKNVNKNPALRDINDKVITEKGSGASNVFEATIGEMVSTKSAVPDVTIIPKGEQHIEVHFSSISVLSLPDKSNSGLSRTAIVEQKTTVSTVAATGDVKSFKSGTENDKGNGAAKLTKSQRRKMRKLVEKESNSMTGGQTKNKKVNRRRTTGEILDPIYLQKLETAIGEGSGTTATDKPASRKSSTQKNVNKNPALGCGDTHDKVIEEKGSGADKVFEATSEMVATKSAVSDVMIVPNGVQNTKVGNGNTATDNSSSKKKKRKKNKNMDSALGDVMKTFEKAIEEKDLSMTKSFEAISREMVTGKNTSMVSKVEEHTEVANGKIATDNPASKNKSRRLRKNKNQRLVDIMITCDNIQEMVISEKGPDINKSTEATSSGMVTSKKAISDALMVSKVKEHTEVSSGKRGPGTAATDTIALKKREIQKLKKKGLAPEGILSNSESTQDMAIANKFSGTNKPLEVFSTESKKEDFPEFLGGEKGQKTITGDAESTMLKTIGCTKVGNSESGSTGTTTAAQNSPLPKKTPWRRKSQTSVGLDAPNYTEVKQITQVTTLGKKLVIFDVNGLLTDVVFSPPKDVKADKLILRRAIFKRPFLDDFLTFCFERFNVGIWSSRTKAMLDPVVDFLLGDMKNKLLFLWEASQCTNSWLRTLENRHKPVVFKALRKIWEEKDPKNRWMKGTFNESNTLLLDDSPYKALLNPKYSGIYPASYSYKNKDDDFLGPKGELRTYLEGLATADDVKSYVEQHPFGQGAIDEESPHWSYYSHAIRRYQGQNRW
uniref:uncharacterized protein LOC122586959 n=1 Tax=Erigeron canadensis TaxID=72917 RepID=UPI001CB88F75|nr:uncharacterized protein LOC122586959 [Erigeron canadensis]